MNEDEQVIYEWTGYTKDEIENMYYDYDPRDNENTDNNNPK